MTGDAPQRHVFVPVRRLAVGSSLRTLPTVEGERVGVAFSSRESLRAAMGDGHDHQLMSLPALQAMLRPLGILRVELDPAVTRHPRGLAPASAAGPRSFAPGEAA